MSLDKCPCNLVYAKLRETKEDEKFFSIDKELSLIEDIFTLSR
jgi:hypothetical protein